MKAIIIFTFFVSISLLQTQELFGQDKVSLPKQTELKKNNHLSDTTMKDSRIDIVINMEMINSYRRCYDKIEVVDWASLFKGASADELGMIYMAYLRLQTMDDANSDTKTLIAEKEKIKSEIANDASILLKGKDEKNTLTASNIVIKRETTVSK
jgi:hypothetical protein